VFDRLVSSARLALLLGGVFAAGVAVGIGVNLFTDHTSTKQTSDVQRAETQSYPTAAIPLGRAAIFPTPPAGAHSTGTAPHEPPEAPPAILADMDPEQARLYYENEHQRKIEEHYTEVVDKAWQRRTTPMFEHDLGIVAGEAGFEVSSVDCRSVTCVATLNWDNFEHARTTYADVLHYAYDANCAGEIILPRPADKSLNYDATVIFNCAN